MTEGESESSYVAVSGRKWLRGQFLTSGGMSKLYLASCDKMSGDFVIKIGTLMTELRIYTKLWQNSTPNCIPEYIDGGINKTTNEEFLILKRYKPSYPANEKISDSAFIAIVRDTLRALQYLHESGYVHNDLKPENILYNGSNFLLCDFGITMKWKKEGYKNYKSENFCGTRMFTGLDMHTPEKGPSPRGDIDSLIFSMLRWCGIRLPWGKLKTLEIIHTLKLNFLKKPMNLLMDQGVSDTKRIIICSFIDMNNIIPYDALPNYQGMNNVLNAQEALLPEPCCDLCMKLELVRDKLLLSDNKTDLAAIKALKYVELWSACR